MDIQQFLERRPTTGDQSEWISYEINPGQCVIRWEYIVAVQKHKDAPRPMTNVRRAGFVLRST